MLFKMLLLLLACSLLATEAKRYHVLDINYNVREVSGEDVEKLMADPVTAAVSTTIDNRNTSGWTYFGVMTNPKVEDMEQVIAAGYMEGFYNYELIWAAYNNRMQEFQKRGLPEIPQNVTDFMQRQLDWMDLMATAHPTDHYWNLVASIRGQFQGILMGYKSAIILNKRVDMVLTDLQFYLLTYQMDLSDVLRAFTSLDLHMPSCSFLLKLTEEGLFGSHTTWGGYTQLLRTYKMVNISYHNPSVHTKRMSFASQPGSLASLDDYYILDGNRVVTETTLGSYNNEVYKFIQPQSLPYWMRVTLANLMATDQKSWADIFYQYRSGTYNNQWLLIDYNQYNASKGDLSKAKDIIWMVEEFYNLTSAQDVTQELLVAQGYVASYNVPYNSTIQEVSQNPTSYTTDPRYKLFKKYAPGIKTFKDFKNVMRLNNISDTHDYCQAISSRCDLNQATTLPWGAFDCKITSEKWVTDHQVWLISGPSTDENLPAFSWDHWPDYKILEMPKTFNFNWEFFDPERNLTYPQSYASGFFEKLFW